MELPLSFCVCRCGYVDGMAGRATPYDTWYIVISRHNFIALLTISSWCNILTASFFNDVLFLSLFHCSVFCRCGYFDGIPGRQSLARTRLEFRNQCLGRSSFFLFLVRLTRCILLSRCNNFIVLARNDFWVHGLTWFFMQIDLEGIGFHGHV